MCVRSDKWYKVDIVTYLVKSAVLQTKAIVTISFPDQNECSKGPPEPGVLNPEVPTCHLAL